MTTPATPSSPKSDRADNLEVVDGNALAPSFEYRLHQFWKKNGKLVLIVCVVILLAILGRGAWDLYQAQQEKGIEDDFAAANTSDKLKAFASAHAGHSLAGVAQLQLADEAYTASRFVDALAGYEKAAAILKTGPLAARAKLGVAMANIAAGKKAEGEAALKQISGDTAQLKSIRAEATYNLVSLAAEAGRAEDVAKLSDQLNAIDQNSSWAQRALMLRSTLPNAAVATPAAATGNTQIKVPGAP